MRFSAFEQAAAEASYGMHEIDTQLEQLRAQLEQIKVQMVQLQSKRNLLDKLSQELLQLKPERMAPAQTTSAPGPDRISASDRDEPPQPAEPPRNRARVRSPRTVSVHCGRYRSEALDAIAESWAA